MSNADHGNRPMPASFFSFPFIVQIADANGFEFGGDYGSEIGGIAGFSRLTDAVGYAQVAADRKGRKTRVIRRLDKGFEVVTTCDTRFGADAAE